MTRLETQEQNILKSEGLQSKGLSPLGDETTVENEEMLSNFILELQPIFSEEELGAIRLLWHEQEEVKRIRSTEIEKKESQMDQDIANMEKNIVIYTPRNNRRLVTDINKIEDPDLKQYQTALVVRARLLRKYKEDKENYSISPDTTLRTYLLNMNDMNVNVFKELGIKQLATTNFDSYYSMIASAFPGLNIRGWELHRAPPLFWNKETCTEAIKWFFEEKIKLDKNNPLKFRNSILELDLQKVLRQYALDGVINNLGYTYAQAINDAYTELKYQPWEFRVRTLWKGSEGDKNIRNAVRWMIEERYGIQPSHSHFREIITRHISLKHFEEAGLGGLRVSTRFEKFIDVLIFAYPELDLSEREFVRAPYGAWKKDGARTKAIGILKDFIEGTLGLNPSSDDFRENLSKIKQRTFRQYGYIAMMNTVFQGYQEAVKATYPELDLQEWEFTRVNPGFWRDHKNVIQAFQWVIEKKFGLNPSADDFRQRLLYINKNTLGLNGMFPNAKLTYFEVINLAYPDLDISEIEYKEAKNSLKREINNSITSNEANEVLKALRRM